MTISLTKTTTLVLLCLVSACTPSASLDTSPPQAEYSKSHARSGLICESPQLYANQVVGDGHCVSLIKKCAAAPATPQWRAGKQVLSFKHPLPLGTIIATFKNGRYPNRTGFHAAIYISHDASGIWVWDQWQGKAVHRRLIRTRSDSSTASNSASAYRVVRLQAR